jgi:hypothetical protein
MRQYTQEDRHFLAQKRKGADMQSRNTASSERLERAHELLRLGRREEAQQAVEKILAEEPDNAQAQALRDRIENENMSAAVVRQRQEHQTLLDDEDTSPALIYGFLLIGIVAAVAATWLAVKPIRFGLEHGFTAPAVGRTGAHLAITTHYPVHLFLVYPVVLYCVAGLSFLAFRRYTRRPAMASGGTRRAARERRR